MARNVQGDNLKIVLVGNKSDLNDKRQVRTDEGEKLAKSMNLMNIETSSKDGSNVEELFKMIGSVLPGMEGVEMSANNEGILVDI